MEDIDEFSMLNQALAGGGQRFSGSGEILHKQEREDLDHMSLAVLGKKVPPKVAKSLAREKLINANDALATEPVRGQFVPANPIPNNSPPINQKIEELESKIEFYKQKLILCESYLNEKQKKAYKQDWLTKVIEAAGDNLDAVAGKGFKTKKEDNNGQE